MKKFDFRKIEKKNRQIWSFYEGEILNSNLNFGSK
jgi:hypothetical protein